MTMLSSTASLPASAAASPGRSVAVAVARGLLPSPLLCLRCCSTELSWRATAPAENYSAPVCAGTLLYMLPDGAVPSEPERCVIGFRTRRSVRCRRAHPSSCSPRAGRELFDVCFGVVEHTPSPPTLSGLRPGIPHPPRTGGATDGSTVETLGTSSSCCCCCCSSNRC